MIILQTWRWISELKQKSALIWEIPRTLQPPVSLRKVKMKLCLSWHLILFSVKVCFRKVGGNLAIKLKFTIQSEMRSRWGRGAKLFKTNVYLEKWALSMGLPVLPECCTNVFTRPEQTTSKTAALCSLLWPFQTGLHSVQDTMSDWSH